MAAAAQAYIDALVQMLAPDRQSLVSVVLFGSAAQRGFVGRVSDVDVTIVVTDHTSRAQRLRIAQKSRTSRRCTSCATSATNPLDRYAPGSSIARMSQSADAAPA